MREIKIKLFRSLILSLVLLVTIFMVVFSWFTSSTQAIADGVNVICNIPDGIEIAIVGHGAPAPAENEYVTGVITLENQAFLKDLQLSEITSDGIKFYRPPLIQSEGIASPDLEADWNEAVANTSYLSFDLYIRSKSTQTVYLDTDSKFTTQSTVLTGEDSGNKSGSGNFSRDCVVGAARFSVLDDNNAKKMLWIPRPDIKLVDNNGQFSIQTNLNSGDSYVHSYYQVSGSTKTLTTAPATVSAKSANNEYTLAAKTEITRLTSKQGSSQYYTNHVTCNMWIEGEDSEARLALVNGNFTIFLDLTIR